MSNPVFNIAPSDYLYFSPKTGKNCAGKPVKILKQLAVAFVAAVDPKSQEGLALVSGIERLTALAQGSEAITNAASPEVKTQKLGPNDVCYTVIQAPGDSCPTVYITDLRFNFGGDDKKSGLYKLLVTGSKFDGVLEKKVDENTLNAKSLYIAGKSESLREAKYAAAAKAKDSDLFYTNGNDFKQLGAWSTTKSTTVSKKLAKVFNSYKGTDPVNVVVSDYGAHLLNCAMSEIEIKSLSKFVFEIENPITNTAQLISELDSKNAQWRNSDIVKIYPGQASQSKKLNASKIALAYSRISIVQRLLQSNRREWSNYAKVVMDLYTDEVRNIPANELEKGKQVSDPRKHHPTAVNYEASYNANTFIELINRAVIR